MILGLSPGEAARIIALPILFVFFNGLVEVGLATSRGLAQEGRSLRVLYRSTGGRTRELCTDPSELLHLRENHGSIRRIVDVQALSTLNMLDYPSIPVNLCFAALSADSLALFSGRAGEMIHVYRWLLPVHIFSLVTIVVLSGIGMKLDLAKKRRSLAAALLALAFIIALLGFIALRSLL